MNDRKKQVMEAAQHLFVEKGFVATSVQDILEKSGISKGTFYNYFPSKKELLLGIFEKIHMETEKRRMEVLAGRKRNDKKGFVEQIRVKMEVAKENNLFALFYGVLVSGDRELKRMVQQYYFDELCWLQKRLIEVLGEQIKDYSLDLAVLLHGMVQNMIHFAVNAEIEIEISDIISYAMRRIEMISSNVVQGDDQLFEISLVKRLEPKSQLKRKQKKEILMKKIDLLEQTASDSQKELLLFLKEELQSAVPRRTLIHAVVAQIDKKKELEKFIDDVLKD